MKKMYRATALLLSFLLLLSLCACSSSRRVRPSARANKVVAKAGNVNILYDELYYLANNYMYDLRIEHGEDAMSYPANREALRAFVAEHLLNRDHAMLSVAADYGITPESASIADEVQKEMENLLALTFEGDRKAYIESLNEEFLTDRYVRTFFYAVPDYIPTAVVLEMLTRGEIDTSDETALALIHGENFARTLQVFISAENGYDAATNRAHAEEVWQSISSAPTEEARYHAMIDAVGGKYNNDYADTLGNGYYFARGAMSAAYEEAAFALSPYEVSPVVETAEGFYIIMRMPLDEAYITANLQTLKESTYFITLNQKVEARFEELVLSMTSFGESLDVCDLPAIRAEGGEAMPIIIGVAAGVCTVGAVLAVAVCVRRKKSRR